MSKDALEAALQKTREMEEKKKKRMALAEKAGLIVGIAVSVAIDTTMVWLVVKFLIGVATFTWLQSLGIMFLANLLYSKWKS